MKIFELNTYCGSGSTGRIAMDIADCAAHENSQTLIGFATGAVPPEAEVYALRVGGRAGRKWHGLIRKLLDMEGYGSIRATRKLIAFLRLYQPDVIQLHNLHGCYLNHRLLFQYLKRANVPVFWTLHDCWPFTGHCAYFDFAGCDRWKTECHDCPQQRSYPVCIGLDGSRRNYRRRQKLFSDLPTLTLVAPCRWMQGLLADSFLSKTPSRLVYNGVNRAIFYPRESDLRERYGLTEGYLALAVASEWEARKGYAFLPALADLLGPACRLAVLGLTEAQIAALPKTILGLPKTASTEELAQWYSAADCLMNPTLEDNMPLVNLEALACGTPVAVFETGGCPECVSSECGAVAPKGDVATLAAETLRLCRQKPAMREACLRQAEQFDSPATAQAYLALYREACS